MTEASRLPLICDAVAQHGRSAAPSGGAAERMKNPDTLDVWLGKDAIEGVSNDAEQATERRQMNAKPAPPEEGEKAQLRRMAVLFVAGLDPVRGGGAGGQLTEAATLFRSGWGEVMRLVPISSTMASVPPPHLVRRGAAAAWRLVRFVAELRGVDAAFIYSGDGASLIEKGLMCALARLAGRAVVVRFGSGGLAIACERSWAVRAWLRVVLRCAHVISVQGQYWMDWFARFREAAGKTVAIGNGLRFGEGRAGRNCRHTLVFVGWLKREKGIFELLEVLEKVREEYSDARLIVAGRGRDEEAFIEASRRRGLEHCVERRGWLPPEEVENLLRQADVFVLPSHAEGLPNAMLEAMAIGLPVVVTGVGSIPDVVDDGVTGFVSQVGDVGRMASCICRLFERPSDAEAMASRGRERVRADFDIDVIWPKHSESVVRAWKEATKPER